MVLRLLLLGVNIDGCCSGQYFYHKVEAFLTSTIIYVRLNEARLSLIQRLYW